MSSVSLNPLSLVLGLFAIGLLIVPLWGRVEERRRSGAAWLAAATMAALAGLLLAGSVAGTTSLEWVPSIGLEIDLRADAYAAVFLMIIGAVGVAVFSFSAVYFARKPGAVPFSAVMLLFAAAMAGIVLSDDLITLFVFWELTTFTSYLLIGHHSRLGPARRSARQAALTTGAGGLVLLAGLVVLALEAGTTNIARLMDAGTGSGVGWGLVLIGAMTKSAQVPFHSWLPSAMAAPTPASAFLHSATMVKAGILLLGRLGPGAAELTWWTPAVISVGLVTMVAGGALALRQQDLKLLLAYGTVSQLGLMFALVGSGVPELLSAGLAVLVAHALYKSALFLVVGVIESEKKTRDIARLSGIRSEMPLLFVLGILATASMASVPLTLGFATKEAALEALLGYSPLLAIGVAAASVLTVAYSTRFALGAFGGSGRARTREPLRLLAAPAALVLVGTMLGLAPASLADPIAEAVGSVSRAGVVAPKLVLWPGAVTALWLSLAGLVLGVVTGWHLMTFGMRQRGVTRSHVFDRGVDLMQSAARQLTAVLQNGSLPVYLGQILLVAAVLPFPALLRLGLIPSPAASGGFVEWIVAGVMVLSAVAMLFVRRRMVAVLLLGALGYGMSALFVVAGAPDVALTQILVETLVVALFALALRVLPRRFEVRFPFSAWKAVVATTAGSFAVLVSLAAASVEVAEPVSEEQTALAIPAAAGENVVNVILVDFRAIDTLGEILVIGVAALGVLALVRPFGERIRAGVTLGRPSPILSRGVTVIGPLLGVLALYLLLAGHNQPGGGFAAGLVASAWVVLRWLAEGRSALRDGSIPHPSALIGGGLAIACLAGLGGLLWGDAFLASRAWDLDLGVLGEVKAVSPLIFDTGVSVVVLGAVTGALRGLEAS